MIMAYRAARGGSSRRGASGNGNSEEATTGESAEPCHLVHVSDLPEHTLEADLLRLFGKFGSIKEVCMLPHRSQALVEFDTVEAATVVVERAQTEFFHLVSRRIKVNFSTSKHIVHKSEGLSGTVENRVLLFTVYNAQHPITVEVLYQICSPHGSVLRIVLFRKYNLQAMVEFARLEDAGRAKRNLNGADIYSGCCTIKVEFAVPKTLTVTKNDQETWDYENPQLGNASLLGQPCDSSRQPSLLREPRPGGGGGGHVQHQHQMQHPMHHHPQQPNQLAFAQPLPPQPQPPPPFPSSSSASSAAAAPAEPFHQRHPHPHLLMPAAGAPHSPGAVVLMVYGLNGEVFNCQRLFNLLCLYGNVVRVKFLRSMDGAAMAQLGDPQSVERAIQNLNSARMFGGKLQLSQSKQSMLMEVAHPHSLPDGSPSYVDFSCSRNNRFTTPELAAKNKIYPPFRTLHFWNCPPNCSDDELRQVFVSCGCQLPEKVVRFPNTKSAEKTSAGLVQWEKDLDASEALVLANNFELQAPGHQFRFAIRLSFAVKPISEGAWPPGSRDRSPFKEDGGGSYRGGYRGGRGGGDSY